MRETMSCALNGAELTALDPRIRIQEIAEREKTSQGKISECLAPALKKIKRILRIRQISPDIRRHF